MNDPAKTPTRRAGKAWVWIVVAVAVLGGGAVALWLILSNKVSSDFDLVPRDAQLFATVRVADAFESEQLRELRSTLEKAGVPGIADALRQLSMFEEQVGLKLTDIERVTFVMDDMEKGHLWFIVHTKKDIDKDKVVALLHATEEKTYEGKTYNLQKKSGIAVHLISSRLGVIAPEPGLQRCLDVAKNGSGSGPLKSALKLASKDKYHLACGVNFSKLISMRDGRKKLQETAEDGDGPQKKLAQAALKLQTITFAMQLNKNMDIEVVGEFETSDAAKDAAAGLDELFDELRATLKQNAKNVPEAAAMISAFEKLKPVQSGSTVTLNVESGPILLVGLMLPSVQKVREAAARTVAQDNFHNITLSFHNYASGSNDKFPPSAIRDPKTGRPLLSWRVALLPEFEQMALYRQFKLDEPWDSPHNIKLLDKVPKIYQVPNAVEPQPGYTFVQLLTGPNTLYPMPGECKYTLGQVTALDGLANVILVATAEKAVPWTAPQDIVVDQGPIKPKLKFVARRTIVGMGDASVRTIKQSISEQMLRWLIDPADGNAVNPDE